MSIAGKWERDSTEARGWEETALRLSGVSAVAIAWELAPRLGAVDAEFLPPLSRVLVTILSMALDGSLVRHLALSSFRAVIGLTVASAIALPVGLVLGYQKPDFYVMVQPTLRLLSQVNPFALMPAFLLVFGIGETVKIVVVAWVALWPILFYTVTGTINVEHDLITVGRSFGLSRWPLLFRVVLPAAVPTLFVGVRIAGGLVFFMLVAAEMLGASGGVGWLVHNSAMNYQVRGIYAAALLVVFLGYALDSVLRWVEGRLVPHATRSTEAAFAPTPSRSKAVIGPAELVPIAVEAEN